MKEGRGKIMVVDIGEVKRHIKPKADSTLFNMRKSDLIEYVRTLEHNYNVGATFLENQAKYIESLDMVKVVRCKDCFANDCCSIQIDLNMGGEGYCPKGRKETR